MEFRNVVFNAARDGKLRRLKVRESCLGKITFTMGKSMLKGRKPFSPIAVKFRPSTFHY